MRQLNLSLDPMDNDLAESEALKKRKRLLKLITSVVVIFFILIAAREQNPGVPLYQKPLGSHILDVFSDSDDIEEYEKAAQVSATIWAYVRSTTFFLGTTGVA